MPGSGEVTQKPEEPSLDDWMAKIREKKLRPVVPNQHKVNEPVVSKGGEGPSVPHSAGDLSKMRQGLRSVSTPKWPGVNDHKAKINTTVLPQRSQLRAVSDRTRKVSESEQGDGESTTSATTTLIDDKQPGINSRQEVPEARSKIADDTTRSEPDLLTAETTGDDEDGKAAETDFPLDIEPVKDSTSSADVVESADEASIQDLSASSGVTANQADLELKLPETKGDSFPLDLEETNTGPPKQEAAECSEEPKTPVTLSSGVFDTKAPEIELKVPVPVQGQDDFPLDMETTETKEHQTASDTASPAVSSGVTDPEASDVKLDAVHKTKKKAKADVNKQLTELREAQDQVEVHERQTGDTSTLPAAGIVDPASETTVTAVLAKHTAPDPEAEAEDTEKAVHTPTGDAVDEQDAIKCSKCSKYISLEDLGQHVC